MHTIVTIARASLTVLSLTVLALGILGTPAASVSALAAPPALELSHTDAFAANTVTYGPGEGRQFRDGIG